MTPPEPTAPDLPPVPDTGGHGEPAATGTPSPGRDATVNAADDAASAEGKGSATEFEDGHVAADGAAPASPKPARKRPAKAATPSGAGGSSATSSPRGRAGSPGPAAIRFEDVITGQFDADEDNETVELTKRVLAPQPESPKLHKVLAQAGLGSRLEMEQLILEGRISVNAEPAHIGQRIQFGDTVKVNGKQIRVRIDAPPPRVIAYHKPSGEVVTHDDPQNRPTVFRRLPKLFQGKWQSVGRLDLNTEGLLLLTSSGELANRLMHPRFGLEREYAVRVLGALSLDEKHRLLDGVQLDDGMAQFGTIEAGGGEGANHWYRVTISEGRNREVRRMFEAVGHAVSRLIRIRYGAMLLPRGLKRGAFVELDSQDILSLTNAVSQAEQRAEARELAPDETGEGGAGEVKRRGPRGGGDGASRGSNAGAPQQRRASKSGAARAPGGPGNGGKGSFRSGPPAGSGKSRGAGQGQSRKSAGRADKPPGDAQPDPMKTSFGYIGADTFTRQRHGQGQRRPGGGNFGGGGAGGGNTGGNFGGPRRGGGRGGKR